MGGTWGLGGVGGWARVNGAGVGPKKSSKKLKSPSNYTFVPRPTRSLQQVTGNKERNQLQFYQRKPFKKKFTKKHKKSL